MKTKYFLPYTFSSAENGLKHYAPYFKELLTATTYERDNGTWGAATEVEELSTAEFTKGQAEAFVSAYNQDVLEQRLEAITVEVPTNLHDIDWTIFHEKRDGYAYHQCVRVSVEKDGVTFTLDFHDATHDLDGDRIAFAAGVVTRAFEYLAKAIEHVDNWPRCDDACLTTLVARSSQSIEDFLKENFI